MTTILNATRAEILRLRKWPAVWVIAGAWLVLATLFGYVFNYVSYSTGSNSFSNEGQTKSALLAELLPPGVPSVLIQGTPMFGGALMMVLGALVAGSGYGWGSWKTIFTLSPARASTTAGSLVALVLTVLAALVTTLVMCFGFALIITAVESQPLVWPSAVEVLKGFAVGFAVLLMWTMAGFLLGTIARGPALSVGLGLVWALVLENLLRGVGNLLSAVDAFTRVLPGTAAGSLVGSITGVKGNAGDTPGVLDVLTGTQAAWLLAGYVVVLPIVALLLVKRRDLN